MRDGWMQGRGMLRQFLVLGALMALGAGAVMVPGEARAELTEEEKEYLKEKQEGPSTIYMILPRIRAVTIPGFVFDLFLDRHSAHWEDGPNLSYGADFVLRKKSYDLVFGLGWADLSQPDDWFLEKDDPARKADWTTFPLSLMELTVGVQWINQISDVFGIYGGAGIGAAVVFGDIEKTDPSGACYAFLGESKDASLLDGPPCYENGSPQLLPGSTEKEDRVPPVLPLINLTLGTEFVFYENMVWRIEGGFQNYFFAGTSVGYRWW